MGERIMPLVRTREEIAGGYACIVYYVFYLDTDDNQYHLGYISDNVHDVEKYLREQFGFTAPIDGLIPFGN